MKTVVNNLLINCPAFGSPKHQPFLILHGWGRNSEDWVATAQAIALQKKYYVLVPDLPGFGSSQTPTTVFNAQSYADFTYALLQKLHLKNPLLLGHSFSGKSTILLASQNHKLAKKIILVAPSGLEDKNLITKIKISIFKLMKLIPLSKSQKNTLLKLLASPSYYHSSPFMRKVFNNIEKQKITDEAQKITTPTLIIWGSQDTTLHPKYAKKLNHLIKNSLLRFVWGAKHHPHLEKPDDFLEILLENI